MSENLLDSFFHKRLNEVSMRILEMAGHFLDVNTLFIAVNDHKQNTFLHVSNKNEILASVGDSLPYYDTYCSLVELNNGSSLYIQDITTHPLTRQLAVTNNLGSGSFCGVPIYLKNNEMYGTICALDRNHFALTSEQLYLLETLGQFLSYIIELEQSHLTDSLTDLFNRTFLHEYMKEWEASEASIQSLGFLFLDLDRFKQVNDTYGHEAGDELLVQFSRRLQECFPARYPAARISGDEFLMIMPGETRDSILSMLQESEETLRTPFMINGTALHLSFSAGISVYPDDGDDWKQILKQADISMYQAKHAGRNKVFYYEKAMDADFLQKMSIEQDLHRAIEWNELKLVFQPQFHLHTGEMTGMEALLRWHHPKFGIVPPLQFIKTAEENGLIVPIGEWVVEEVCRIIQRWEAANMPIYPVSINVSTRQLQNDFVSFLERMLSKYDIPSSMINIELTESFLADSTAFAVLNQFQDLCVDIAIDDFGTGFSSLSYLERFPVQFIKIDQSFIQRMLDSKKQTDIVHSIIVMAHALEAKTIAEGVETSEQAALLKQLGCDWAQGYHFSQPVNEEELRSLLKR
ncbi:hypothetical protein BTO30_01365 [Domibacillus antri]|uniref:Diguanylate cyclase n=1 Tax=Domibacillus antri TaxID=1714264 RepID=A0A1Q8Q9X3_9BACI|nr:EAL domain-containing protein [Domibacillus antri]OLN24092.1 hypothetical protein BTO30_01365 [Domibacillus antri]